MPNRTTLALVISTTVGLSSAAVMFVMPGQAAPLPASYAAQASADVWQLNQLDLDMSGDPVALDLGVGRAEGLLAAERNPRSLARAENIAGTSATGEADRRGTVSTASNGADTTSATAGTAPGGTVADYLQLDDANLSSRGRWVGDGRCLPASERLTDSRALSGGSNLVATAVPAEDPSITIPVVDIEIPLPPDGGPLPPLPDPLGEPTDIPDLPIPTETPTELPTEIPSDILPTSTDVPTIPTELPSTILPTLTGFPRPALSVAGAAAAGEPVSMVNVAPAAVEQHTWLAQKSADPDVRGVRAETIGTPINVNQPVVSFFDGEIAVRMATQPRLTAYADGISKGTVTWTPPTMTLLVAGQSNPATIPANGTPVTVNYSGNRQVVVEVSAGQPTAVDTPNSGLSASAEVSALNVKITRETAEGAQVVLDADLFPMRVEANSPSGGVECDRVRDSDGDGLDDVREDELGTNPNRKDTDRDGLTDGQEVKKYRTKPLKPDTDRDKLKDGAEVKKFRTKPRKPDTDGDRLKDGVEVRKYGTNPRKKDTDGDGVSDYREVKRGTDPTKKG